MEAVNIRIVRQAEIDIRHVVVLVHLFMSIAITRRYRRTAHSWTPEADRACEGIEIEVRDVQIAVIGFEGEVFVPLILFEESVDVL